MPFGSPVVPLEKNMTAVSKILICLGSNSSSVPVGATNLEMLKCFSVSPKTIMSVPSPVFSKAVSINSTLSSQQNINLGFTSLRRCSESAQDKVGSREATFAPKNWAAKNGKQLSKELKAEILMMSSEVTPNS